MDKVKIDGVDQTRFPPSWELSVTETTKSTPIDSTMNRNKPSIKNNRLLWKN